MARDGWPKRRAAPSLLSCSSLLPTITCRLIADQLACLPFPLKKKDFDISKKIALVTRIRDRMYCQTMRTVRYISRDDRARIAPAVCELRQTDRQTDLRRIIV